MDTFTGPTQVNRPLTAPISMVQNKYPSPVVSVLLSTQIIHAFVQISYTFLFCVFKYSKYRTWTCTGICHVAVCSTCTWT